MERWVISDVGQSRQDWNKHLGDILGHEKVSQRRLGFVSIPDEWSLHGLNIWQERNVSAMKKLDSDMQG